MIDFLLQARVLDVQVEAAPAQGVPDLPAAVGGQDDVGDVLRADRAELGDRHLEVGEDLQEKRLEPVVRAVHLVHEEHGRALAARDRAQERPLEEVLAREDRVLDLRRVASGLLSHPDPQHLARVVPLVESGRDVQPS
jgi:hypothetical protein